MFRFISALLIVSLLSIDTTFGQTSDSPVTITLSTQDPGQLISPLALGLSYETKEILPNVNGDYYFHPQNKALISMFKTLGVKHLRIGGNSVDSPNVPLPSEKDVRTFFEFADAAGLKIVYSLRLQDGDIEFARQVAKIINDDYKHLVESIAIGNEPSYYKDNALYIKKWMAIHDAVLEVYPEAVFSGPDSNPNVERMRTLSAIHNTHDGRFVQLTQHSYPFGCSYKNPGEPVYIKLIPQDRATSREKMLDTSAYQVYQEILNQINDAKADSDLSFRLSETNSYWYSGLREVSNSFASALWGLDYLYWWTTHGAEGLNFHTGDITGGLRQQPTFYAAFVTSDSGYAAMPIAYGMKLFSMGSSGRVVPVEVSAPDKQNIVAYATISEEGSIYLTIINKEFKESKQKITVHLDHKITNTRIRSLTLKARNNDIAEINDISLGGKPVNEDGSWEGEWNELAEPIMDDNSFEIKVSNATAVLVKIDK